MTGDLATFEMKLRGSWTTPWYSSCPCTDTERTRQRSATKSTGRRCFAWTAVTSLPYSSVGSGYPAACTKEVMRRSDWRSLRSCLRGVCEAVSPCTSRRRGDASSPRDSRRNVCRVSTGAGERICSAPSIRGRATALISDWRQLGKHPICSPQPHGFWLAVVRSYRRL